MRELGFKDNHYRGYIRLDIRFIDSDVFVKMVKQGTGLLESNKDVVDALNVFPVPDGDTGTNMSLTMGAASAELLGKKYDSIGDAAKTFSRGLLMGARGNSGVILSQIFRGFSKGCEKKDKLDVIEFANALKNATDTAYKAVMKPVEGTILTVIREVSEKGMELIEENETIGFNEFFEKILYHGQETLDKTPEFLEVLKQAGVVDAGGKGLMLILTGFYNALLGVEDGLDIESFHRKSVVETGVENVEEIKFGYCTEFILRTDKEDVGDLKNEIFKLGDSMVFVQDEDLVKIHVHTNNPGKALESALLYGDLVKIKIDNMREQHSTIIENEEKEIEEMKDVGFIAVALGDGISKIFRDLGVDFIIEGGQTMNPSTEDILRAINSINAKEIVILPNNSNIILAANQAKSISDKNVHVIKSKTISHGIASMIGFNHNESIENNVEIMSEIIEDMDTIQVTYSVRDTVFNDQDIKKDDILAVVNGEIKSVGKEINPTVLEALEGSIDEDKEIITLYYGSEVSEDEAEELSELIEEKFEDLEVEIYYGGQPLYYYLMSIE